MFFLSCNYSVSICFFKLFVCNSPLKIRKIRNITDFKKISPWILYIHIYIHIYIYIYIYIYIRYKDAVVWLWHSLVTLYIWRTIWSGYGLIPFVLGVIERDGGLSTLCHSCGFDCQQRVLKTFPGPGYLRSEDGVVWLWNLLVN